MTDKTRKIYLKELYGRKRIIENEIESIRDKCPHTKTLMYTAIGMEMESCSSCGDSFPKREET